LIKYLEGKLKTNFKEKNESLKKLYNTEITIKEQSSILKEYVKYGQSLKKYIRDVSYW